jgi:hypothetical protein
MQRNTKRAVPPGRDALAGWIATHGVSVTRFGLDAGIDPAHLRHILKGRRRRLSVDVAIAIEDATGGDVGARLWCEPRRTFRSDYAAQAEAAP